MGTLVCNIYCIVCSNERSLAELASRENETKKKKSNADQWSGIFRQGLPNVGLGGVAGGESSEVYHNMVINVIK